MITVMTWYWQQPGGRVTYTPEHVNTWASMVRRNTSLDIDIACVTEHPEGIDPSVRIIEPPGEFLDVQSRDWSASSGKPQCYRRVAMFSPHAADWIGNDRFCSMDMDCIIAKSIDPLLRRSEDFVMFSGTSGKRPYNGSMVLMTAGCRSKVYTRFTPERARRASAVYLGSDQAWISYCLGKGEATFKSRDGVDFAGSSMLRQIKMGGGKLPKTTRILFTPGDAKPWRLVSLFPNLAEHYQ